MPTRQRSCRCAVPSAIIVLLLLTAWPYCGILAQNQQSIPDAPSATRPFPRPQVSPTSPPASPDKNAPESQPTDSTDAEGNQQAPPPPPNITTVPQGGAT